MGRFDIKKAQETKKTEKGSLGPFPDFVVTFSGVSGGPAAGDSGRLFYRSEERLIRLTF